MPNDFRIEELERDVQRLYKKVEEVPVMIERIDHLVEAVNLMREENRQQHKGAKVEMDAIREDSKRINDRILQVTIGLAGLLITIFGAAQIFGGGGPA